MAPDKASLGGARLERGGVSMVVGGVCPERGGGWQARLHTSGREKRNPDVGGVALSKEAGVAGSGHPILAGCGRGLEKGRGLWVGQ